MYSKNEIESIKTKFYIIFDKIIDEISRFEDNLMKELDNNLETIFLNDFEK
jgi:hypothetical protein